MVTWGAPSTATPAPAGGFSFGSTTSAPTAAGTTAPAPTSGGLFGSAPAPAPVTGGLFGSTTAPAPTSGGLFGSAPAPAPVTGGLFGSTTAPAPTGGLFGSTAAPASTTGGLFGSPVPAPGLFGASAAKGSLFGSPAPSTGGLFGSNTGVSTQQQQQQWQTAAALVAQQQQQQDMVRIEKELLEIKEAYNCTAQVPGTMQQGPNPNCKFQYIFYDIYHDAGQKSAGVFRPVHVSEKAWVEAEAHNPDPDKYYPVSIIGADGLQRRIETQHKEAENRKANLSEVVKALTKLKDKLPQARTKVESSKIQNELLRKRLLEAMKNVELLRCLHVSTQDEERMLRDKLNQCLSVLNATGRMVSELSDMSKMAMERRVYQDYSVPPQDIEKVEETLSLHRQALQTLGSKLEKDLRDVGIMKNMREEQMRK